MDWQVYQNLGPYTRILHFVRGQIVNVSILGR